MEPFLAFALGFGCLQAFTYLWVERRNRDAWVHDIDHARTEADLASGFRGDVHHRTQTYRGPCPDPRAPLPIRAIGLWSIGMGQMVVPGAFAAAVGVFFYGAGLLGIPGCVLAGRIWSLGPALLRAERTAPARARAVARFAYRLNACVVLVAVMLLAEPSLLGLGLFTLGYAVVSLLHASALEYAADVIEALWRRRGYSSGANSPQ